MSHIPKIFLLVHFTLLLQFGHSYICHKLPKGDVEEDCKETYISPFAENVLTRPDEVEVQGRISPPDQQSNNAISKQMVPVLVKENNKNSRDQHHNNLDGKSKNLDFEDDWELDFDHERLWKVDEIPIPQTLVTLPDVYVVEENLEPTPAEDPSLSIDLVPIEKSELTEEARAIEESEFNDTVTGQFTTIAPTSTVGPTKKIKTSKKNKNKHRTTNVTSTTPMPLVATKSEPSVADNTTPVSKINDDGKQS